MAKFEVNQRVKIIAPDSIWVGREGIIWAIVESPSWTPHSQYYGTSETAHRVKIDGEGFLTADGSYRSYAAHDLAPLTPPSIKDWATEQVKQWTKPNTELVKDEVTA